jgi:hypothetical protein
VMSVYFSRQDSPFLASPDSSEQADQKQLTFRDTQAAHCFHYSSFLHVYSLYISIQLPRRSSLTQPCN